MFEYAKRSLLVTFVIVSLISLPVAQVRGDFVLRGDEKLEADTEHDEGKLYDRSQVLIVPGGGVLKLHSYNSSAVDLDGGWVRELFAWDSSTIKISAGTVSEQLVAYSYSSGVVVDISGGYVNTLRPLKGSITNIFGGEVGGFQMKDNSIVNVFGGKVGSLTSHAAGTVNLSGGQFGPGGIRVLGSGVVTFHARDFRISGGLSLSGARVLGTGSVSGEWFDGTYWEVNIKDNHASATIRLLPEPATLLVLVSGAMVLLLRRKHKEREL